MQHSSATHWAICVGIVGLCAVRPTDALGQVVLDASLGTAGALPGPDYQITADFGLQAGANLFHSFSQFDLASGESAVFSGPADVSRIISRVTGGAASQIDGTIRSTIASADLYLVNPSGIVFGPNSSLDLTGSFIATSADFVELDDGNHFSVADPPASILTAAPPVAFGFLADPQGGITLQSAALVTAPGQTLALIGGPVTLTAGQLVAPNGTVNLASAASAGRVELDPADPAASLELDPTTDGGPIALLDGSAVIVAGPGGGTVVIRAGELELAGSDIAQLTDDATAGRGIDIETSGDVRIAQSGLSTRTTGSAPGGDIMIHARTFLADGQGVGGAGLGADTAGAGPSGSIHITADQIELFNGAGIGVSTTGTGDAGQITVTTELLEIDGRGFSSPGNLQEGTGIATLTSGPGNAGSISVVADELNIRNGAVIAASAFASGNAGSIDIRAATILLDGEDFQPLPGLRTGTGIGSPTFSPISGGDAGAVQIMADQLVILRGAGVSSSTLGSGDGGRVQIDARSITIDRSGASFQTGIFADTTGTGIGGDIQFGQPDQPISEMHVIGGGVVSSVSFGSGQGGVLTVFADALTVDGDGFIPDGLADPSNLNLTGLIAPTVGPGDGGGIEIHAGAFELKDRAVISADTSGSGRGGNIQITSDTVHITTRSGVFNNTFGTGDGGDVSVVADVLSIDGQGEPLDYGPGSQVSTVVNFLRPDGVIEPIVTIGETSITTVTIGSGQAGDISITAGLLDIRDVAEVSASSLGTGAAGDITIDAGIVTLTRGETPFFTGIASGALGFGPGGTIRITAERLDVVDGGLISADTFGPAIGGDVIIDADRIHLDSRPSGRVTLIGAETHPLFPSATGGNVQLNASHIDAGPGAIISAATFGAGGGGQVDIVTDTLSLNGADSFAAILAETYADTAAPGGDIRVTAEQMDLGAGGLVSAASFGTGAGGDVTIDTHTLRIADGGLVRSTATSLGRAGDVVINAQTGVNIRTGGSITTAADQSTGGNITVDAGLFIDAQDATLSARAELDGGRIELSAAERVSFNRTDLTAEAGNDGGNITIRSGAVLLNDSLVRASAVAGDGGDISIVTQAFLVTPGSVIDASSQFGVSGSVQITSPDTNLAASLGRLSDALLNARAVLTQTCYAQVKGGGSSFVMTGRGGIPLDPVGRHPSAAE